MRIPQSRAENALALLLICSLDGDGLRNVGVRAYYALGRPRRREDEVKTRAQINSEWPEELPWRRLDSVFTQPGSL